MAPTLAAAKVPVIVFPLQQPNSFDALGAREDNAALLDKAGVAVAISTGDTHNARKLRQVAGNAVRSGLPTRPPSPPSPASRPRRWEWARAMARSPRAKRQTSSSGRAIRWRSGLRCSTWSFAAAVSH